MSATDDPVIGQCRKCKTEIRESHPYVWCHVCNDPITDEVNRKRTNREALHPQSTRLIPCPDCRKEISSKAESCPNCGRFIQYFDRKPITVLPGKGWSWAVTGGIILSYLVAVVVGAFLLFLFAGVVADLGKSTRP